MLVKLLNCNASQYMHPIQISAAVQKCMAHNALCPQYHHRSLVCVALFEKPLTKHFWRGFDKYLTKLYSPHLYISAISLLRFNCTWRILFDILLWATANCVGADDKRKVFAIKQVFHQPHTSGPNIRWYFGRF